MNKIDRVLAYNFLITDVYNKIGALVVTYLASKAKLNELYKNTDWFDPSLDRRENKHRMKTAGSALFGYESFLAELTIIGLAKTIEDIVVGIEELLNINYNIWKDDHITSVFHKQAKIIRSLNNVIKHDNGYINRINKPSGKYLVEECGYPDDFKVSQLATSSSTSFDMLQEIAQVYIFLWNLVAKLTDQPCFHINESEDFNKDTIIKIFVPDYLNLDIKQ